MRVPVVFSIDKNVVVPCGVTITSLLLNANTETFYDFYVLFNSEGLGSEEIGELIDAFQFNKQCELHFIDVENSFSEVEGFAKGHVSTATYYRLAIPDLLPQYDRVIYADIDMIFQQDLSELFVSSIKNNELIAAVLDLAIDDMFYFQSDLPAMVGKSEKDYFNAGFLVMNLKQMRKEGIMALFKEHTKIKYAQNDQDILNIVCNGRVQILPSTYNFQLNHFLNYMWGRKKIDIAFGELFKKATLHYTWKHKPWNSMECVGADTWWYYYKMSPFFDDSVYFKRQQDQLEACRNDYHRRTNKQLFLRILANLKHKLLG